MQSRYRLARVSVDEVIGWRDCRMMEVLVRGVRTGAGNDVWMDARNGGVGSVRC